jgi:hypothetical protein
MNALDLLLEFANSRSTPATTPAPTDVDRNHDDSGSDLGVLKSLPQGLQQTFQEPQIPDGGERPVNWTRRHQAPPSAASHERLLAEAFAEANANMLRERTLQSDWTSDRTQFEQRHHHTQPFHDDPHMPTTWMPERHERAYFEQGLAQQFHCHPPDFSHEEQLYQHPYGQDPPWANLYTPGCTVRLTDSHREAHHSQPTFHDAQVMMQYPMRGIGMPNEYIGEDGRYHFQYLPVQEHRAVEWRHGGQAWA